MRYDTVIRKALLMTVLALPGQVLFCGQKKPQTTEPPEILVTEQSFLVINTPKGWIRTQGRGLAYFIRKQDKVENPSVWIYINSAPIGPDQEAKDANAYIQSDISDFKKRFKTGTVKEEKALTFRRRTPVRRFIPSEAAKNTMPSSRLPTSQKSIGS